MVFSFYTLSDIYSDSATKLNYSEDIMDKWLIVRINEKLTLLDIKADIERANGTTIAESAPS